LEDQVTRVVAQPGARVLNRDPGGSVVTGTSLHDDGAILPDAFRHRVHGVEEEVQHDLAQLDGVALDGERLGGQVEAQRDVPEQRVAGDQLDYVAHEDAHVQGRPLDLAASQKVAQPLDPVHRPPVVVDDIGENLADLAHIGGVDNEGEAGPPGGFLGGGG